jgi:hypothetical protein
MTVKVLVRRWLRIKSSVLVTIDYGSSKAHGGMNDDTPFSRQRVFP